MSSRRCFRCTHPYRHSVLIIKVASQVRPDLARRQTIPFPNRSLQFDPPSSLPKILNHSFQSSLVAFNPNQIWYVPLQLFAVSLTKYRGRRTEVHHTHFILNAGIPTGTLAIPHLQSGENSVSSPSKPLEPNSSWNVPTVKTVRQNRHRREGLTIPTKSPSVPE